jgi:hypothetical protein
MTSVPLPVRLLAGLTAVAAERAKDLPKDLSELPVTLISQVVQAGMRIQQDITELAIKGDELLAHLQPVEEKPAWATFDEDDDEEEEVPTEAPHPPAFLPDYNGLAVTQLRARLRQFDTDQLTELLSFEQENEQRPAFVGMLQRRIDRLASEQ